MLGFEIPDFQFGGNDDARLRRIERKLDLLIDHLGLTPEPPEWQAEIDRLIGEGQKIAAIRALRKATGWGLKEAKGWVDDRAAGRPLPYEL